MAAEIEPETIELSLSPEEQVEAARSLMLSSPDKPELRLDLIADAGLRAEAAAVLAAATALALAALHYVSVTGRNTHTHTYTYTH